MALTPTHIPRLNPLTRRARKVIPMLKDIANASLRGDRERLRMMADSERLETTPAKSWQRARVDHVRPSGFVALDRLAFAWLQVVYESPSALGHKPLLVALREPAPIALARPRRSSGPIVNEQRFSTRGGDAVAAHPSDDSAQAAVLLDPLPVCTRYFRKASDFDRHLAPNSLRQSAGNRGVRLQR